jgi:NADH-quinone oxidoreductase subunit K
MNFLFTRYPLENILIVSVIIFCAGFYTIITRKNAISILMGIELVLNATNINFIAFSRYAVDGIGGTMFVLFVILLAASEAAVALAIIIGIYRNFGSIDVDEVETLKG